MKKKHEGAFLAAEKIDVGKQGGWFGNERIDWRGEESKD